MSRKSALIGAGMLTGMIASVLLILSFFNEVQANAGLEIPPPIEVLGNTGEQQLGEFEAALTAREAALQDQLDQRQMAIETLDDTYQNQFTALEGRLEETNSRLTEASDRIKALQKGANSIEDEIGAADQSFQEEMTGLQNSLSYKDAQMRQEIESVYAQIQVAYDQIATQEALAMANGGGGSSSGSNNGGDHGDADHDDRDDDDDDDHDNDDHDDDHDND